MHVMKHSRLLNKSLCCVHYIVICVCGGVYMWKPGLVIGFLPYASPPVF